MLTNKELRVMELFRLNLFSSYTIREVMKKIGTKSYNWTYNTVNKLVKENLISCERKGKSQICRINLKEHRTIIYLSFLEELNTLNKNIPNLKAIVDLMPMHFHTLIIGGSYANSSYSKKSDLDIVVIIDKKEEKKAILNKLTRKGELMIPMLHPYVFTRDEFLEMLINKETNYGKE